jgi:hypothetical protein
MNLEGQIVSRLTFTNALITEIGFPALDAASKDAAKMTIKLSPEYTRYTVTSSGEVIPKPDSQAQKKWLSSNFRLRIDGLAADTREVIKLEALVFKQKFVEHPIGESRVSVPKT